MKETFVHIAIIVTLGLVSSCKNDASQESEAEITPKTPVEVVAVSRGAVSDEITLFGNTFYLKRNVITAPIPAFIVQVNVKLGDKVSKGDVLYVLQSKESRALGNDLSRVDSTISGFGIINVKAPASGIVSTLDKQQIGDYVLEGIQLCTVAESNDLIVQVNVPFEYTAYTKTGNNCTLTLPDNSNHSAVFTRALSSMNVAAQTQTILAKPNESLFLPENMIVKVSVKKSGNNDRQVLPKSCVLSDEMLTEHWVMKLMNDSTAVKVPVIIGNKDNGKIEVIAPNFNADDRIISSGNFGLPDTALVSIINGNRQ